MRQIAKILPKDNPLKSLNIPDGISSLVEYISFVQKELGRTLTQSELEECKVQWRQYYQKRYHTQKRKKQRRTTLSFSNEEYQLLKSYANLHRISSLNAFIKKTSIAYVEQKYVPRHVEQLEELTSEIQSIGRNINQIVQRLHRKIFKAKVRKLSDDQYALFTESYNSLLSLVESLEKEVQEFVEKPPLKLEQALDELLELHPGKREDLIEYLQNNEE